MRAADAVYQLRPRLSLRGRLYLFSGAILILFAINVGTSLWGSLGVPINFPESFATLYPKTK